MKYTRARSYARMLACEKPCGWPSTAYQYLDRPHVVALNKLDVPMERGGEAELERVRIQARADIIASAKVMRVSEGGIVGDACSRAANANPAPRLLSCMKIAEPSPRTRRIHGLMHRWAFAMQEAPPGTLPPTGVVALSGKQSKGIKILREAISKALEASDEN